MGNLTKGKIAGMEPTRQTTRDQSDTSNEKEKQIYPPNNLQPISETNEKTNYAAPALWGNSRREGVFNKRSPTTYINDTTTECNGTPKEDWLRQQAIASIRRQLSQPEKEESCAQDKDYRSDNTQYIIPLVQFLPNSKDYSLTPQVDKNEDVPDNQSSTQKTEEDTYGSTEIPSNPSDFPVSLNSIKEYVTEKDGGTYLPLHSTIVLNKRQRMLYLPLGFGEITMDGLVDSGAFINAMSWSDYFAIKMNSDSCVIKVYPQLPFKIECANAQLEQPIATADIQFNIGTYTFTDTFVILSRTSSPIIGLNFI